MPAKGEGVRTMAELMSQRYEVKDMAEAIEFYYARGWTDGLPVVPPTENSIWGMLESAGLVRTERQGRYKFHYIDWTPLGTIVERWSRSRRGGAKR